MIMENKRITINGFNYYYRIYRNENEEMDPVFFVSGVFQTMESWGMLYKRFLPLTTVILSDSPKVRSLVFTGEYDIFTRPVMCREIAAAICNSVFTTIRNADHLFHIEQKDTMAELVYRLSKGLPLEEIKQCNGFEYFN